MYWLPLVKLADQLWQWSLKTWLGKKQGRKGRGIIFLKSAEKWKQIFQDKIHVAQINTLNYHVHLYYKYTNQELFVNKPALWKEHLTTPNASVTNAGSLDLLGKYHQQFACVLLQVYPRKLASCCSQHRIWKSIQSNGNCSATWMGSSLDGKITTQWIPLINTFKGLNGSGNLKTIYIHDTRILRLTKRVKLRKNVLLHKN